MIGTIINEGYRNISGKVTFLKFFFLQKYMYHYSDESGKKHITRKVMAAGNLDLQMKLLGIGNLKHVFLRLKIIGFSGFFTWYPSYLVVLLFVIVDLVTYVQTC